MSFVFVKLALHEMSNKMYFCTIYLVRMVLHERVIRYVIRREDTRGAVNDTTTTTTSLIIIIIVIDSVDLCSCSST